MARIFISYSRKDTDFIEFLVPKIHNIYGLTSVWYDKSRDGIQGGDDWWNIIINQIQDCGLFLFLMSNESVQSETCQQELQAAIDSSKVILPILIKSYTKYPDGLPEDLSDYMRKVHYIELRDYQGDLTLLWGAINRIRDDSLSKIDRWILYNQFEILRLLNNLDDRLENTENYEKAKEIIRMGYVGKYSEISYDIMPPREDYGVYKEVMTILDMYRAINNACIENVDCVNINSPYLKFLGFDFNKEFDYYIDAKFIMEDEGKYAESRPDNGSDLNSHCPMLTQYRRMVEQWMLSEKQHSLTKEDVIRIVEAIIY